jgi:CTP synthase
MTKNLKNTKYIFVTGGVVSSLGKGVATASIGYILKSMGYSVFLKKLDPYLNIDPGTMNPKEHGEVFVTKDGMESDLDLGHYERFTGVDTTVDSNITAGKIYYNLLEKERNGDYLGQTVQVIPHVTNLIKEFIKRHSGKHDFTICEIGGTVGDIEALPFFEAVRQIKSELPKGDVLFVHLTLIPFLHATKEMKTKPTQHSVKELMSIGIIPDVIICRTEKEIGEDNLAKIASFCNVDRESVIQGLDTSNIYDIPLSYTKQGLDRVLCNKLNLGEQKPEVEELQKMIDRQKNINAKESVKSIALIGKYTSLQDSYKSLTESIKHAAFSLDTHCKIEFVDARKLDKKNDEEIDKILSNFDGFIVPGGFGTDGLEGMIKAIKYIRERNLPFLGICLGMQMTVIEFARNVLGIKNAHTQEVVGDDANYVKIVSTMESWEKDGKIYKKNTKLGGSMRLGEYKADISKDTLAHKIYKQSIITERHRHRYEVDISFKDVLEGAGLKISGVSSDSGLPEIAEITGNKFFIAVQYHPEFNSSILKPNPLFVEFIKSC